MGAQEAPLHVLAVEGDHVGIRRRRDTRFLGDGLCCEHQQAKRGEDWTVSGAAYGPFFSYQLAALQNR